MSSSTWTVCYWVSMTAANWFRVPFISGLTIFSITSWLEAKRQSPLYLCFRHGEGVLGEHHRCAEEPRQRIPERLTCQSDGYGADQHGNDHHERTGNEHGPRRPARRIPRKPNRPNGERSFSARFD